MNHFGTVGLHKSWLNVNESNLFKHAKDRAKLGQIQTERRIQGEKKKNLCCKHPTASHCSDFPLTTSDGHPPSFHQAGGYTSHLYSKQIIELGHEHAVLVSLGEFQDQFHVNV